MAASLLKMCILLRSSKSKDRIVKFIEQGKTPRDGRKDFHHIGSHQDDARVGLPLGKLA
jgi:hypothetical protein